MDKESYDEIMGVMVDTEKGLASARAYHLAACLTDLEHQFRPENLATAMLTEQFGRILRAYTQEVQKRLGTAIRTNPDLNANLDQINKDMAEAIDLVAHRIMKRHFNEMADRFAEMLKNVRVYLECRLSGRDSEN